MRIVSEQTRLFRLLFLLLFGVLVSAGSVLADQPESWRTHPLLRSAQVLIDNNRQVVQDIRLREASALPGEQLLQQTAQAFGLSGAHGFKLLRREADLSGRIHERFLQTYDGIPLAHVQLLVHRDASGAAGHINGQLVLLGNPETQPSLGMESAREVALAAVGAKRYLWEDSEMMHALKAGGTNPATGVYPAGELVYTRGRQPLEAKQFRLAWRFDVFSIDPFDNVDVFVDARSGEILNIIPLIYNEDVSSQGETLYNGTVDFTADSLAVSLFRLQEQSRGGGIQTLDLLNSENYAAAIDFEDNDNFFDDDRDRAAVSTHWALEATYDYFLGTHGRNSFDNNGTLITAYVHALQNWNNAQWLSGLGAMRFGDGDGLTFNELVSVDVVAHEFTHGVTQYTAGLIYQAESGALNESFSDIFGTHVEFFLEGATAGDWLIGEDVMANNAASLRSMENPNAQGNPDTYFGDLWAPLNGGDNGGVHSNSGVNNFWFYLLSEGGSGINDNGDAYTVAGIGLAKAAEVAYRSLSFYLTPSSGFNDARLGSINAAVDLYGKNTSEYLAVIDAWNAVGVYYPSLDAQITTLDSLDFLAELGLSTDARKLHIVNTGLDTLIINSVQLAGSGFQFIGLPGFPLELPGYLDTLSLDLLFVPPLEGLASGTVSIETNDLVTPVFSVTLSGLGYTIHPVQEGQLYAVGGRASGGKFFTVDQYSGAATEVGASNFEELRGASVQPATGQIFATVDRGQTTMLVRINAQAGSGFNTVEIPLSNIHGIAFDSNGDLYALGFVSGDLFRIDVASGDTTLVGATGLRITAALAINPLDGQLYALSLNGQLYQVDKNSGQITVIGASGITRPSELVFDAAGKLYGIGGYTNDEANLLEIDVNSGAATIIGPMGYSGIGGLVVSGTVTGIGEPASAALPQHFALRGNYPNPFNPSTTIRYDLPVSAEVSLVIYNALGQEVRTLVKGQMEAGFRSVQWNGRDNAGKSVGSGIYFYRLRSSGLEFVRKAIMLK